MWRIYLTSGIVCAFVALSGCDPAKRDVNLSTDAPLTRRELFERKRTCMEVGLHAAEREQKTLDPHDVYLNTGFNYDPKRNTCVWHGGFIDAKGQTKMEWVTDTFTNVEIAES